MSAAWQRHAWAERAPEATVALVRADDPAAVFGRLGPSQPLGELTFDEALEAQGRLYDDGTEDEQAVVQVAPLRAGEGAWVATVEPNGFRADLRLGQLAGGAPAVSVAPLAASLALVERWTGVVVEQAWLVGPKPTHLVQCPLR